MKSMEEERESWWRSTKRHPVRRTFDATCVQMPFFRAQLCPFLHALVHLRSFKIPATAAL